MLNTGIREASPFLAAVQNLAEARRSTEVQRTVTDSVVIALCKFTVLNVVSHVKVYFELSAVSWQIFDPFDSDDFSGVAFHVASVIVLPALLPFHVIFRLCSIAHGLPCLQFIVCPICSHNSVCLLYPSNCGPFVDTAWSGCAFRLSC